MLPRRVRQDFSFASLSSVCEYIINSFHDFFAWVCDQLPGGGSSSSGILPTQYYTVNGICVRVLREGGAGEGGFAYVDIVEEVDRSDGVKLALKRCICQTPDQLFDAQHEVDILLGLQPHEFIVPLVGHDVTAVAGHRRTRVTMVLILMPYFETGSLHDELERRKVLVRCFNELELLLLFRGICLGVYHMHQQKPQPIAHRDIKPANVLLSYRDGKLHPYLTDFGSSRPARVHINSRKDALILQEEAEKYSTMAYRPPELWSVSKHSKLDERTDIWSLGCLLFAMAYGSSPFDDVIENGGSVALAVESPIRFPSSPVYSEALQSLIQKMLKKKLKHRPFVTQLMENIDAILKQLRVV